MGSGPGCHAQYLFAEDILGTNPGHYPRHSKRYADLQTEYARIQGIRVDALKAFAREVESGAFPGPDQLVQIEPGELEGFLEALDGERTAPLDSEAQIA